MKYCRATRDAADLYEKRRRLIRSGGRRRLARIRDFLERWSCKSQRRAIDQRTPRIGNLDFEWKSGKRSAPICSAGNQPQVCGLARTIDPPICEQIARESLSGLRIF